VPTQDLVLVFVAKVHLQRRLTTRLHGLKVQARRPIANIPRVLLPAAEFEPLKKLHETLAPLTDVSEA
jgi:hypothetical protein